MGTSGLHFLFGSVSWTETGPNYFREANTSTTRTKREFSDSPAEPSNPETKARRQSHGAMYSLWKTEVKEVDLDQSQPSRTTEAGKSWAPAFKELTI